MKVKRFVNGINKNGVNQSHSILYEILQASNLFPMANILKSTESL